MDIDYAAGRITYDHADLRSSTYDRSSGLPSWQWLIETHVHADHLSAAPYIQIRNWAASIGIGKNITIVQDDLRQGVQRGHRVPARRQPVRRGCSTDGDTYRIGEMTALCHAHARPHAGLHDPRHGRRRISSATRCSCPMAARRGRTSPAATPEYSTTRSRKCWPCRMPRDFSCATTTAPNGRDIALGNHGRQRRRAHNIHVGRGARPSEEFVRLPDRARCRCSTCRNSSFRRCRSTCAPANGAHRQGRPENADDADQSVL